MIGRPFVDHGKRPEQAPTEWRQFVGDRSTRRLARHEPVPFQDAQRTGEFFGTRAIENRAEFAEPQRPVLQRPQHQRSPFVAHPHGEQGGGTQLIERVEREKTHTLRIGTHLVTKAGPSVASMTRIVVFGASGRAGSAAVAEARERGHEATPLTRTDADVTDPAAVAAGAAGHEVAIAAVADASADPAVFFPAAAHSLVAGLKEAGVTRLVWVSLASLLPDAAGVPVMDTTGYPPEFQPFSLAHRAALDILRDSDLEWVAVSPSGNFDLDGSPSGKYRTSVGDLTTQITYADHAKALLDEAERATSRKEHIGVVAG